MNKLKFFIFLLGILIAIPSCKEDACESIICLNNSTCNEGTCECPTGYTGVDCGTVDHAKIQDLLNSGVTPKTLYDDGIMLEHLYGKIYNDGIIFYLNTTTGTGLLASIEDENLNGSWGCYDVDISNLNNVTDFPLASESETKDGAKIGDGQMNTNAILAECFEEEIAAKLCRNIGAEWFLPSRDELNSMYNNLHLNGHGNFANVSYWTSTEYDGFSAWFQNFNDGFQGLRIKVETNILIRAIKHF